ncbi:MAG: hypothetical protein ACR2PF_06740 [Rhizobiaceae bacterium]
MKQEKFEFMKAYVLARAVAADPGHVGVFALIAEADEAWKEIVARVAQEP